MAEQAVWRVRRISLPIPVVALSAVRSRLWMLDPPLLLGLLGALLAMQMQKPTFRARAEVSIAFAMPARVLPYSSAVPTGPEDAARFMDSQATIARSPELARRVVAVAGVRGLTVARFLAHSRAEPQSNAAIVELSVSSPRAAAAVRLTNAYAEAFTRFKRERDVAVINKSIWATRAQLQRLRDSGQTDSPPYDVLIQNQLDLKTERALLSNSAAVLGAADGAAKVRPHGLRNGIFGGVIGALLGLALVVAVQRGRRQSRRT